MTGVEIINRQQRKVLKVSNIFITIGVGLNLVGIMGAQAPIHIILILSYFFIIVCLSVKEYIFKDTNLRYMIGWRLLLAQLLICIKMVLFVFSNSPNTSLMITTHMAVFTIILLFSLLAYLKCFTYILSLIAIVSYTFCAYIINSHDMWRNLPIYILLFSVGVFLSSMLTRGISAVLSDNEKYKVDMQEALATLGMTENEFNAYIELTKKNKKENKVTLDIFNIIGDRAREMLKQNVIHLVEQDKIVYDKVGELIPEFTPSEVEIAKLIIEGKKIGDMISILDKKKSNITCQRTKMRVKLNLSTEDNLRDAILKRVNIEQPS